MNNYTELPSFQVSLVGGRARPRRFSADPFSSPVPAWAEILGAAREAVPMAPLKHPRSYLLDDGPHSEIRYKDLIEIRRRYGVSPLVRAGFLGVIPFLVAALSLYFGFCPSPLTPLTWRTLMAIQVLGEFHGFSVGVHEVLYLYYFSPLVSKPGFYHLRSREGAPLVDEPSRGLRGNYPFGDDWDKRYVFVKVLGPLSYPTFWCTVGGGLGKASNGDSSSLPGGGFSDEQGGLTSSLHLGTRKRRPFYIPPPRLTRTIPRTASLSSCSPCNVEAALNKGLETGAHQRLLGEVLFLHTQVRDMMALRDLLIQRVRTFARWELMREWLEKRIDHWDPVGEYRCYLLFLDMLNVL
ncbi:hypothetical protein Bca101_057639 [Brassica carinata]